MEGKVQLAKQPFYRDPTITNKHHPKIDGFTNIQVCSNTKKGKELSPMCLHIVLNNELVIFENFWQNLKVYSFELDNDGNILPSYFIRRDKNFKDTKGHRRVFPKKLLKEKNAKVEFVYYNNKKYNWIDSRKEIYCPMYAEIVKETTYFKQLKERFNNGEKLLIIGYDGFNFDPENDDVKYHLEDTSKPVGHEFVICFLF